MQLLVKRFAEEANFQETLEAWAQDSAHFRIACSSSTTSATWRTIPISEERLPDEQDNLARMRVLTERFSRGEFSRDDAEFAQLLGLMQSLGKTEIARREGIVAELVPLAQFRCDPAVDGPENIGRAAWFRHDILMLRDDVLAKWPEIDPQDLDTRATIYGLDEVGHAVKRERIEKTQTANQAQQIEVSRTSRQGNQPGSDWFLIAEVYDLETNHRLVLIEGLCYPVVDEPLENMPTGLVPFEVLVLNRVPRRLYGFSDTELQAKIQDRINWKRSEEEEARDNAKPRWGYDPAVINDPNAVIRSNAADPYEAVPIPVSGKGSLKDAMVPLHGNHEYNEAEFDTGKDEQEMRRMAALPEQALGVTGNAKFSREVLAAQQGMNVMARYRQSRMARGLKRVYQKFAQLLVFNVAPDLAARLAGPLAPRYWPQQPVDRQKVYEGLDITVNVAMDATMEDARQLDSLVQLTEAGGKVGARVDQKVFTRLFARFAGRLADVDDLFQQDPNQAAQELIEALQANPGALSPELLPALVQTVMATQKQAVAPALGAAPGAPGAPMPPGMPPAAAPPPMPGGAPMPPPAAPAEAEPGGGPTA
jgi:hypothetical protein